MFGKGTLAVWMDSNSLNLVFYKKNQERRLIYTGSIDEFLKSAVLEKYRGKIDNVVIIVPDDWVSRKFFPFHSPKKKYIKPFILRQLKKITDQDDQLPHYHYYCLAERSEKEKGIYVYYLTKKECLLAMRRIDALGFEVSLISSPGLLWGERLKNLFKKRNIKNTALMIHGNKESLLFMYNEASFVFSRRFDLREYSREEEALQSLVFEMNQSFIYFTQKYKSEVELVALIDSSSDSEFVARLKESINKEILVISEGPAKLSTDETTQGDSIGRIQLWTYFAENDFLNAANIPNLLPDEELKTICYGCFERAGIVVGTVLLLIFSIQVGWMYFQYRSISNELRVETRPIESVMVVTLNKWNDAANAIIDKATKPSIGRFLAELGNTDIPLLQLNVLEYDMYTNKELKVSGLFKTEDIHIFRQGIETLMKSIRNVLPDGKDVTWENVTFQRDVRDNNKMYFRFEIRAEL